MLMRENDSVQGNGLLIQSIAWCLPPVILTRISQEYLNFGTVYPLCIDVKIELLASTSIVLPHDIPPWISVALVPR